MTDRSDSERETSRRELLAAMGAAGVTSLAGCSMSTPVGDFSFSGSTSDDRGTATPSRTSAGGPSTETAVRTDTPTGTPPPLNVSVHTAVATVQPVGASVGDPSAVTDSGAVRVEVTPDEKGPKRETLEGTGTTESSDMVCTTQRRRIRAGGPANFLLDPQIGTIWPGAVLTAGSIAKGQFNPALSNQRREGAQLSRIRNPIQLSVSLMNVSGKNSTTVETPSLGNVRSARDSILGRYASNANTPARQKAQIHQVHSSEKLSVDLGVHYNSPKVDVDNEFDFTQESETNKLLAKFWQVYYTLDVSLPNPVANGLVSDAETYLRPNDVIVKNVSYGRILLFSAESNYERTKVKNALNVAVGGLAREGSVDLTVGHENVLRDTKIDVQVLGGSATQGAKTISKPGEGAFESIKNWIQQGARYDPQDSPGVPIAYQTKYVGNLATANTYLTTTYTARNCRPKSRAFRVHNVKWRVLVEDDPGNKEEIYGNVYISGWPSKGEDWDDIPKDRRIEPRGQTVTNVWDRTKSQIVNIGSQETYDLGVDAVIEFDGYHDLDPAESHIKVVAEPYEKDPLSDNDFGTLRRVKWFLDQPTSDPDTAGQGFGKFRQTWSSHGSRLELSFDITPIPP